MQNDPHNPNQHKSSGGGQPPRTQGGSQDRPGTSGSSSNPGSGEKRQFSGVRGRDEQSHDASQGRGGSAEITGFLDAIEENCTKLRAALSGRESGSEQQVPALRRGAEGMMDTERHTDTRGRDDEISR